MIDHIARTTKNLHTAICNAPAHFRGEVFADGSLQRDNLARVTRPGGRQNQLSGRLDHGAAIGKQGCNQGRNQLEFDNGP